MILTESVIDALSCIEAGVMNVLPLYGTNGYTDEHAALIAKLRPARVALAMDNDDAGRAAIARLAEQLARGDRIEVERDLMMLLDAIERHQAQRDESTAPAPLAMRAEQREEATALLLRADLLDVIAADMEAIGYVGETTNKQLGYLVAVSRSPSSTMPGTASRRTV